MAVPSLEIIIEQVEKLSNQDKQKLLAYLQAEIQDDESYIEAILGDTLHEDGSIDFDAIYKRGK